MNLHCLSHPITEDPRQFPEIIRKIAAFNDLKSHAMHDAFHSLLQETTLEIEYNTSALELIIDHIAPIFRHAVNKVCVALDPERTPETALLFSHADLPGLASLHVQWSTNGERQFQPMEIFVGFVYSVNQSTHITAQMDSLRSPVAYSLGACPSQFRGT